MSGSHVGICTQYEAQNSKQEMILILTLIGFGDLHLKHMNKIYLKYFVLSRALVGVITNKFISIVIFISRKRVVCLCQQSSVVTYFWWLVRVTLVVAFGFLPQNFGRWRGPMNGTLSFYECRFSGA